MDSSIHNAQQVTVTSRDLGKGLGMTTRIVVSSRASWNKEDRTEEIVLFSKDKLITSLNGKTIPHEKEK
jgi:hypothetical protein